MKKACYYGELKEPFTQICRHCGQRGKVIPDEQRERISASLTGIKRSPDFRQRLSHYMTTDPEGRARATRNLIDHRGTGFLGQHHTPEAKAHMSKAMSGRTYSDEHRRHISEGRKAMLQAQGGFTQEHRANIKKANGRRRPVQMEAESTRPESAGQSPGGILRLSDEGEGGTRTD